MNLHNKKHYYFCLILLSFIMSHTVHAAEYIYISDNLRVGIRAQPVSGMLPISVAFTGMRLKVEERIEGYIKVTTSKGVTGWIKDIYATKEAPATIQLKHLRTQHKKLKEEHAKSLNAYATLEKANLALNEKVTELKAERRELENERATLMAKQYNDSTWFWVAGIILLVFACFAAGAMWYRTQAMKRLGGLRV